MATFYCPRCQTKAFKHKDELKEHLEVHKVVDKAVKEMK